MTTGLEQSIIRLLGSHMAPPDLLDLSLGNDSFSAAILTDLCLIMYFSSKQHSQQEHGSHLDLIWSAAVAVAVAAVAVSPVAELLLEPFARLAPWLAL